mmetsp:Transcript_97953/g.277638  ORF Transcript_97953/g.277638 Transcript_97953/m.277638 type:complete len:285 (+) Transcript_97953:129-983(+)
MSWMRFMTSCDLSTLGGTRSGPPATTMARTTGSCFMSSSCTAMFNSLSSMYCRTAASVSRSLSSTKLESSPSQSTFLRACCAGGGGIFWTCCAGSTIPGAVFCAGPFGACGSSDIFIASLEEAFRTRATVIAEVFVPMTTPSARTCSWIEGEASLSRWAARASILLSKMNCSTALRALRPAGGAATRPRAGGGLTTLWPAAAGLPYGGSSASLSWFVPILFLLKNRARRAACTACGSSSSASAPCSWGTGSSTWHGGVDGCRGRFGAATTLDELDALLFPSGTA